MTTTMATAVDTADTTRSRASRAFPFSGRRRQRAAGERVAALYDEHGRMVYGVCRLVLRDPIEAEDAAQQTFLSAYRGLLAGQEPREPSAWLGTIARNECRSRIRARKTEPLTAAAAVATDDTQRDAGRRVEIEALCAALGELPAPQRDAIVLREFYGLSYAEVGAALGLSGAAVESLLFRSRKRLQAQLRPIRSALGILTLPWTLRESLAASLPGFGGAGAGAAAGAAVLAKVGSAPMAAKIAAATLAVGTAGTVAGVEAQHAEHAQVNAKRPAVQTRAAPSRRVQRPTLVRTAALVAAPTGRKQRPGRSGSGESGSHESGRHDETRHHDGSRREQVPPSGRPAQIDHSGPGGGEETVTEPVATVETPEQGHDRNGGGGDRSGSGGDQRVPEGSGSGDGSGGHGSETETTDSGHGSDSGG